jgi:hypothetical protein
MVEPTPVPGGLELARLTEGGSALDAKDVRIEPSETAYRIEDRVGICEARDDVVVVGRVHRSTRRQATSQWLRAASQ